MPELASIYELQRRIALYEDMKAYEKLYDLFSGKLQQFCFSFVKSVEVAEEIVSDVFIKVWQIRSKLTEINNLRVYLYTIAKNFSLNYIARNFKNPVISIRDMEIEPAISFGSPEELCISADIIHRIKLAIRQLPPQCLIIFQLVREDGLQYREVAEILDLSVLTIRNQVAIATKKIAEALPEFVLSRAAGSPAIGSGQSHTQTD